jgi:cell wall-associated NlpC family hydrolase
MYIGNGEFIHAPQTGDVVKISSLSDPAYALGYVGAVRVIS